MGIHNHPPEICPLCGSFSIKIKLSGIKSQKHEFDVYECRGCGLGITHPFPAPELLAELYSGQNYRDRGKRFIGPVEHVVKWLRGGRLRKIEALAKKGHLLDIGCGRGLMLAMAKENGWAVTGVELNAETASHARYAMGITMKTGRLSEIGFDAESFDAITLWHSLEHMPDAVEVVRVAAGLLKPGGLLLVSVPNFSSLQSLMSGPGWFHLDVPFHLYHFSASSIKRLLKNAGLDVMREEHLSLEFNPFGFIQSALNMAGLRHNLLYDILRTKKLRPKAEEKISAAEICITALLLPIAGVASVFFTALEVLLRKGGTINIYARKSPLIKARLRNPRTYPSAIRASSFLKDKEPRAHS